MYYRGAHAALVVYDLTKRDSFERAQRWVTELLRNAPPTTVICLVGNKTDLEAARQVSREEARQYAEEAGLLLVEASAKTGDRVAEAFELIAGKLPRTDQQLAVPRMADSRRVDLGASGAGARGSLNRGCC